MTEKGFLEWVLAQVSWWPGTTYAGLLWPIWEGSRISMCRRGWLCGDRHGKYTQQSCIRMSWECWTSQCANFVSGCDVCHVPGRLLQFDYLERPHTEKELGTCPETGLLAVPGTDPEVCAIRRRLLSIRHEQHGGEYHYKAAFRNRRSPERPSPTHPWCEHRRSSILFGAKNKGGTQNVDVRLVTSFFPDTLKYLVWLRYSVAGSETTSMAVTQTLLLLVNNPEKLKSLVREIDTSFPSPNDEITFSKTQDLKYLNAVIYEALRLSVHPTGEYFYCGSWEHTNHSWKWWWDTLRSPQS